MGSAAVHLAAKNDYGRMVALHGTKIESVPLEEAVAQNKYVDPNGEMVQACRSLGINFCSDEDHQLF
jgi:6-phosphofructokinase 1